MPVAVIILLIVLIAIALRRVIRIVIPIWGIMAIGAIASILLQQISPFHAFTATVGAPLTLMNILIYAYFL